MRTWTVLFFALSMLVGGAALATHHEAPASGQAAGSDHAAADDHAGAPPKAAGHQKAPPKATSHAKAESKAAGHGEPAGHAKDEVKADPKPASPSEVGMTAALVLLLAGAGAGLVSVLRAQLG